MASALYLGQVMHRRFGELAYQFRYKVMSIRVDVDSIQQESTTLKWLSMNRFNLYSLHFKDYGARDDRHWRKWADELLQQYALPTPAKRIELVCFPRFLGVVFNPLAMWYAYDEHDQLVAVIGEVSNTFGQWHHYVLTNQGNPLESSIKAQAEKVFHVSPFIGMDCAYRFRFKKPNATYQVVIEQTEKGEKVLLATQDGQQSELTNSNLFKAAIKHPFNTLKVLILIHWWALKIWLKGGKFHKTPKELEAVNYGHTEMTLC